MKMIKILLCFTTFHLLLTKWSFVFAFIPNIKVYGTKRLYNSVSVHPSPNILDSTSDSNVTVGDFSIIAKRDYDDGMKRKNDKIQTKV